jgi:MFS family permease
MAVTTAPLRRNRDFVLLQTGQFLSGLGSLTTSVAYPLLVLATTKSPLLAGTVGFVRVLPVVLFGVFGGVAADRYDRKALLVGADVVSALAVGSVAAALVTDRLSFAHLLVVAFVQGTVHVVFRPATMAALRSIVPADRLPSAISTQEARNAVASLVGPPLGGVLFAVSRALPFLVDALSYLCSAVSVLLIRAPLGQPREPSVVRLRDELAEGWRFLWHQPFLRTTTFLYGLTNVVGPGVMLSIVVIGERQGLPAATIGLLLAAFSGCILVGASLSGYVRQRLSPRAVMLLELCAWPAIAVFLLWPNAYVLAAALLPAALVIPVTDSVVASYRLRITPDHLVGRVESVRSTLALAVVPISTLGAGFLLTVFDARTALLAFVAVAVALPIWGALSPALRAPLAEPATVPA